MKEKEKDIFDKIMALPGLNIFEGFYQKYKEMLLYLFFGGMTAVSGHDKVESCDLLALKNYLWRLPSDREKVEAVLTRLCVNPMQDKVNNIRGMALESQEEFDAALGDGSKADTVRKAFIKLRGELTHLYQMQCSLRTAAQSDSEIALVDDLLADLEKISRKAHEQTHFTYTTLEEIAALN